MTTSIHIMQDSYGFMWASTISGITRFDGESYRHYVKSDSIDGLPDVFAYHSYEDKNKNIWIALYDYGLAILDRDSDTFQWLPADTLNPNGLHLSKIKTIAHDSNDNIYFLGTDGIQRVHLSNDSYNDLKFETQSDFIPDVKDKITGLCLLNDRKDDFWIGSDNGIYKIGPKGKVKQLEPLNEPSKSTTHSILEDSSGAIYFVRGGEPLLKFDPNHQEFETDSNLVFPDRNMLSIIDQQDNLWTFVRPGDILKYNLKKQDLIKTKPYELPYNIHGSYFRAPYVSKEGTLWLCGAGSFPFQHQPRTNKEITPILHDQTKVQSSSCVYVNEAHIFVGQLLGGVKIIDKKTGAIRTLTKDNSRLVDNRIYQIYEIDKNRLVFTGRSGVYVYDLKIQKITKLKRFNYLMRCGYYAGNDIMWVSGETRRIYKLNLKDMSTTTFFDNEDALPEVHTVTQIVEDKDGSIWIGGRYQNLYHYFPASGKCEIYSQDAKDPKFKLFTSIIEVIHIDDEGDVWVGGRTGIDIIDQTSGTISSIGRKNGLKHLLICDIIQDDQLNYWITTDKDISRIDKKTKEITTYDSKDGFINSSYYYRSLSKFDGNIFVAGESGVDQFNPSKMGINSVPPQVVLSNVQVMGKEYDSEVALENLKKIKVNHDQNFIDLDVLAMHYVAPDKNKIAYKFDGVHEDYIDNGNRKNISFSGLSPGIHSLWIKGSNSDNIWSDPMSLTIDVAYPWWRTWTFYLCTILSLGLTGYWIMSWYLTKIRNEQEEKERISTQMAELELKALSSQMNPHFLFNSLNSIKSLINQHKNVEASDFIIRYSRLIRKILNNSRSKFVRLQEEVDVITLYLELEKLRLGDSFTYEIQMDEDVDADFIEIPPSLLQPYVENSIWHGLLNKERGDKHLSINIRKLNDFLEIRIKDNGIGREASRAIQSQSILKNKSLGTTISKERINLISDLYGYESTVNIVDLKCDSGQAIGTEVHMLLHIE